MEAGMGMYSGRFADIRTGLVRQVDLGVGLIEELLKELDCTKATLKQTKLDLDNERDARRRLQQEVEESREWKERQARRPFVVALIDADADGYVFSDSYITRGAKGGEDAADKLLTLLRHHVREKVGEPNEMDILVRAYANVGGLGAALVRDGRLKDSDNLRAFATGFSSRQPFFDFVDVGAGKERADFKVQGAIKFFLESFQCKHLVLGCGHDSGYAPCLRQFVGDKQVAERITLLEGSPFPAEIRDLGLKKTQFNSLFNKITRTAASAGLAGPAWERGAASAVVAPFADRGSDVGRPIAVGLAMPILPETPRRGYHNPHARTDKLGPMLMDDDGRRVDRTLQVNKTVMNRVKKWLLCYYLFLRGECVSAKCTRNHEPRLLTDEEFNALWCLARQGRCYKSKEADRDASKDCLDAMCIYGHRNRGI